MNHKENQHQATVSQSNDMATLADDKDSLVESFLENMIFRSRWILAAFYLMLVVALFGFACKFAVIFWHYISHVFSFSETEILIELLSLVDMTLLANLILIVIFSGYENFVSVIGIAQNSPDRPKWMGEVDFSGLKLKLIGSMVALSGIKLLGTFLGIKLDTTPNYLGWTSNDTHLAWMIAIHITFVVTGVLFALSEKLGHGKNADTTH